jgi:hypothetical protein
MMIVSAFLVQDIIETRLTRSPKAKNGNNHILSKTPKQTVCQELLKEPFLIIIYISLTQGKSGGSNRFQKFSGYLSIEPGLELEYIIQKIKENTMATVGKKQDKDLEEVKKQEKKERKASFVNTLN